MPANTRSSKGQQNRRGREKLRLRETSECRRKLVGKDECRDPLRNHRRFTEIRSRFENGDFLRNHEYSTPLHDISEIASNPLEAALVHDVVSAYKQLAKALN